MRRTQDISKDHQSRLRRWRDLHPSSDHHYHDLDHLEELKSTNDVRAQEDIRERPDVCRGYPTLMTIGNTHKCNIECPMCFKQLDPVDNATWPDLGFDTFEAVAHEVFPHVRRIRLSVSGEPFLSNTIDDELDLCSTYGVRTTITTNGTLLHRPGLLERVVLAVDQLSFSIDAATQPIYEYLRTGASFHRVIDNVRLFNEVRNSLSDEAPRPLLHFIFVLQRANVTELPQFIELAHALDADLVSVDYVVLHAGLNESDSLDRHRRLVKDTLERAAEIAERRCVKVQLPAPLDVDDSVPDDSHDFQVPSPESVAEHKGRIHARDWRIPPNPLPSIVHRIQANGGGNREFVAEQGHRFGPFEWGIHQLGDSLIPPQLHRPNRCLRPWSEAYIDYDGAVAPCENANMSYARHMGVVGKGTTFREIWNGSGYQSLRRSLRTGANFKYCYNCYIARSPNEADWKMHYHG